MKHIYFLSAIFFGMSLIASAATFDSSDKVMSEQYYKVWNDDVQKTIDQNIEKYRKADAKVSLHNVKAGTDVIVEQISSDFLFGSNSFLFGQLDTPEKNKRYQETFGTLFNAATVAFYWKTLEPQQGAIRFTADSPYEYRRPATDPVVDYFESRGVNMNGHAIVYGLRRWGHPTWMPEDREQMEEIIQDHVKIIARRYKGRLNRWDVVNEPIDQANRGLMPDDYTYKTYSWAMKYFPKNVMFNINDTDIHWGEGDFRRYCELVRNLIDRGVKIDNVGIQSHIFDPKESLAIAQGKPTSMTPDKISSKISIMAETGRPIHLSEITISAPDDTSIGNLIQAEIAKNLYRLWFSTPSLMGITWWNLVDGGAAPGEPSYSGLYDKDMNPKPVYFVLDELINHQWRTNLTLKADEDGNISFRGFKGEYRIRWTDRSGKTRTMTYHVQ